MRTKTARLSVSKYLTYTNFERRFVPKFNDQKYRQHGLKLSFDLRRTQWADLMELICVGVAGEHLKKSTQAPLSLQLPAESSAQPGGSKSLAFVNFCQSWHFIRFFQRRGFDVKIDQLDVASWERIMPVTDLGGVPLADVFETIGATMKYHFPRLPGGQIFSLISGIVFEACENAKMHAYDDNHESGSNSLRAIAIRWIPSPKSPKARRLRGSPKYTPYWMSTLYRLYPDADLLDITVVDGGVGIYARLGDAFESYLRSSGKNAPITESACLKWAISPSRSTYLPDRSRGFGLFRLVRHVVKGWGGTFHLRSGHTKIVVLPREEYTLRLQPFPGTQIRVLLPIIEQPERVFVEVDEEISRLIGGEDESANP